MRKAPFPREEVLSRQKILDRLNEKKTKNSNFSVRLLAKKVNMNSGSLSSYLKGKRGLNLEITRSLMETLGFAPHEISECLSISLSAVQQDRAKIIVPAKTITDPRQLRSVSSLESFAVLSAIEMLKEDATEPHILQKTGLSKTRAETLLTDLQDAGLIEFRETHFIRTYRRINTPDDEPNEAANRVNSDAVERAREALKHPVTDRDITTVVMPSNPKKLQEAKLLIRDFQDRMMALLEDEHQSEVLVLAVQLYPFRPLPHPSENSL